MNPGPGAYTKTVSISLSTTQGTIGLSPRKDIFESEKRRGQLTPGSGKYQNNDTIEHN
jgi:hypothetical protein